MKKDEFRSYTHGEGRTGMGQLVEFTCRLGEIEKIKDALLNFRHVELPQTHVVNVGHGSYGRYSRFDVKQHKYAGGGPGEDGGWGYIEVLEVSSPPAGRCGFIIHQDSSYTKSSFTEWESIDEAIAFWEKHWSKGHEYATSSITAPGFKREVKCGLLTPWFYAIGEQGLIGDYAFPEGIQEDPVFRFGTKCLVPDESSNPPDSYSLKICMGCRVFDDEPKSDIRSEYIGEKTVVRIICWNDGTCWDSRRSSSCKHRPRPLQDDELWVDQTLEQFHKLLHGKQTEFVINFAGGGKFIGRFVPEKVKGNDPAGKYYAKVIFKEGGSVEGGFDFTPTNAYPTAESKVRGELDTKGKTIESINITRKATEKGGKKWSGVFFIK